MYKHSFALLALLAVTTSAHDWAEVNSDLLQMGAEIEDMGADLENFLGGALGDGGSADQAA